MRFSGGDVAVVGAGLIGLAVAFELAERGATVRVFERGEPGHAASWAGAGMLAPYSEIPTDEAMLELCARSLAHYPEFVERIKSAGGADPQLHRDGIVHATFDDASFARTSGVIEALKARGVGCDPLDRTQLLAAEPWIGAHARGGFVVHGEGHVDNRRLGRALVEACKARGVLLSRVETLRVECDARRALGVRSDRGFSAASVVVNACGAWSSQLEGVPESARVPVEPVKGQMLALQVPAGFVRRATWVPGAYLVPRDDGRLLIGATSERVGFDARVTADGVAALLNAALVAAPSLGGFSVTETWAGLRPGTPDGRPFIGPAPAVEGLFLATGHYRNGILLVPATAWLVAEAIEGRAGDVVAPFLPARLESKAVATGRSERS